MESRPFMIIRIFCLVLWLTPFTLPQDLSYSMPFCFDILLVDKARHQTSCFLNSHVKGWIVGNEIHWPFGHYKDLTGVCLYLMSSLNLGSHIESKLVSGTESIDGS